MRLGGLRHSAHFLVMHSCQWRRGESRSEQGSRTVQDGGDGETKDASASIGALLDIVVPVKADIGLPDQNSEERLE